MTEKNPNKRIRNHRPLPKPVFGKPAARQCGGCGTWFAPERFSLVGIGTDVDGEDLTYDWTQVSGPVAVIRDPDSSETVVDGVDGAAKLVFRLTVTDPSGATSTDEVTVSVNPK